MNIKNIGKGLMFTLKKNSPTILACMAGGGVVATGALCIKQTPKAIDILNEYKTAKLEEEGTDELTYLEYLKCTWKTFLPPAITAALTIACIAASNSSSSKQKAAVFAAYEAARQGFEEYKYEVRNTIGEKKERAIRDKIAQKHEDANDGNREIIDVGRGTYIIKDDEFGRYFKSNIDEIERVVKYLNQKLEDKRTVFITLNDFYYELGLSSVKRGEEYGWHKDFESEIDIDYSSAILPTGEPCIVINTNANPLLF